MSNPYEPRLPLPGSGSVNVRIARASSPNPTTIMTSPPPSTTSSSSENSSETTTELIGVPPGYVEPPTAAGDIAHFELVEPASPRTDFGDSPTTARSPFEVGFRNLTKKPLVERTTPGKAESESGASAGSNEAASAMDVNAPSPVIAEAAEQAAVQPVTAEMEALKLDQVPQEPVKIEAEPMKVDVSKDEDVKMEQTEESVTDNEVESTDK